MLIPANKTTPRGDVFKTNLIHPKKEISMNILNPEIAWIIASIVMLLAGIPLIPHHRRR